MSEAIKNWSVRLVKDGEGYTPPEFYVLEGRCKRCNAEKHCLIIMGYKTNKENHGESVFQTRCLCCGANNIYYAKDVNRLL